MKMTIELYEIIKILIGALYTLLIGVAVWAYNYQTKRIDKLDSDNKDLAQLVNDVKLQYLEKTEIEKIEARIDRRFDEMRTLMLSFIEKVK
jgi:hypothetical protein